jgi:replicative DNA helicase
MSKDFKVKDNDTSFLTKAAPIPNDKIQNLANKEESLFLSLLLRDKDLIADAVETGITYNCFQNEITKKIFLMAAEHFDRHDGNVLSRTALDSMLSGVSTPEEATMFRSKYDSIISEFGVKAGDYSVLKENMEARFIQRQAYSICQRFLTELLESTRNQKQIVSKFQNLVSEITAFGSEKSFFKVESMAEILDQLMVDTEERRLHPEQHQGIKCLFPKIDADYNGFVKQRYMVITATEGGGKTTFMMNLARNFAVGNNVVYVTIESTNMDVGRRLWTMQSGVSYNRIMRGGNDKEFGLSDYIMEDLRASKKKMSEMVGNKLWMIQVLENTSRETICRLIQRVMAYNKVDVVFIDYLQVVGREANYGERVDQAIADVSGKFRAWGRKNDVLLVTANQIKGDKGRKLQEKASDDDDNLMITKGDTSGTKEISGAADYMFGCWIPFSRDRMIVWSTKTRAGKDTQKYTLTYDAESGRLEQMGEFEDVENVAKIITDKYTRQKIRQKFESGDKTPMNAVPSEQFGAEPPVEISMPTGSYVDDVFTSNRDSFMDND